MARALMFLIAWIAEAQEYGGLALGIVDSRGGGRDRASYCRSPPNDERW